MIVCLMHQVRHDFVIRHRMKKMPPGTNTDHDRANEGLSLEPTYKGLSLDPASDYASVTLPKLRGVPMAAEEMAGRQLLMHEKFNACHVTDIEGAKHLVETLCRTSRLPRENSIEALELLQRAWAQHDVTIYLAKTYKRLGRLLYALYLIVGQAAVAVTAVFFALGLDEPSAWAANTTLADEEAPSRGPMQYTLFGLSMAGSCVLIADRFFNPMQRGGQLRAGAAQLESIIWRFRTRVGAFAVPQSNARPKGPDYALRDAMTALHEALTLALTLNPSLTLTLTRRGTRT